MERRLINETAKAWGLTYWQVLHIAEWVEENADKQWQGIVLTKLLRRRRAKNLKKKPVQMSLL